MVQIKDTNDSKENSHVRYTGTVRIEFGRGESVIDVDDETAETAVESYDSVVYADDDTADEGSGAESADTAGAEDDTRTEEERASDVVSQADGMTARDSGTRESKAPHAQQDTDSDDEP